MGCFRFVAENSEVCQHISMHFSIKTTSDSLHSAMPDASEAGPSTLQSPTQPLRTTKETHPNLPPGLILGPDGKPCKVCNSWQDWAKLKVKKRDVEEKAGKSSALAGMGGFAVMMSGKKASQPTPEVLGGYDVRDDRRDCPADTEALGRSTWTFLHTTAAYYPVRAPPTMQDNMRRLIESLGLLYPCAPCAEDFQVKVNQNPPDLSGREGLSRWMCERHNEVNEKLGKERFDCSWKSLDERWKDGPSDGRCD